MLLGLVGKPNAGKSTFFAAVTETDVKIANYPFTTIDPNKGVTWFRIPSPENLFGVRASPRNYRILGSWAFVPVNIIDVAGLVPGAHQGRGLGNKFLDDMRQAEVLILVVDASGKTDLEGNPTDKPMDPLQEIRFLETEINMWMKRILSKNLDRILRKIKATKSSLIDELETLLTGISVRRDHIQRALEAVGNELSANNLDEFVDALRRTAKPFVVALNKSDLVEDPISLAKDLQRVTGYPVIPCSAMAELALRKAAQAGFIEYIPGDSEFRILESSKLTIKQAQALEYIKTNVLEKLGSTGVQEIIDKAVLDVAKKIVVFPVENEKKLSDSKGNVLPDAIVLDHGATLRDLAAKIHSDFAKRLLYGLDVRTGRKLSKDDHLEHLSIVKLVVAI
jgi:ribosome-binding ATPase YchF (GTP1/OBG family)